MKFRGGEFSTGTTGNFQPELTLWGIAGSSLVKDIRRLTCLRDPEDQDSTLARILTPAKRAHQGTACWAAFRKRQSGDALGLR
jgi:hypothetical protein